MVAYYAVAVTTTVLCLIVMVAYSRGVWLLLMHSTSMWALLLALYWIPVMLVLSVLLVTSWGFLYE